MSYDAASNSLDFSSLSAKASEMIDAADAPAPAPPATEQPAAPAAPPASSEAPLAAAPTPTPATPEPVSPAEQKIIDLADDAMVRIKVNGQEVLRPAKEAQSVLSGEFKFTTEMQKLSEQRKQFAQEQAVAQQNAATLQALQAERQQIQNFLRNPQAVHQYLQTLQPQQPQQAPNLLQQFGFENPNEVVTVQQALQMAQHISAQQSQTLAQQFEQRMNERLNELSGIEDKVKKDIFDAQETQAYINSIDSHVATLFEQQPILQAFDGIEELIRYRVSQMDPANIQDTLEAFTNVASEYANSLKQKFTELNKQSVVAKHKLETQAIEPPGGAAPQPTPVSYKTPDGKLDWNKLRQAAEARLG